MSTITREQLRERAREKVKSLEFAVTQIAFADSRSDLEEELELARIALASLEAEPVGYFGRFDADDEDLIDQCSPSINGAFPLYAAPPAPVAVPECFKRLLHHAYGMTMGHDWNKGTMAGHHRTKLCQAVEECRAAMLQGAENSESRCTIQTAPALHSSQIIAESPSGNSQVIPDCSCGTCRPVTFTDSRFVVCSEFGNKRCPHANDHQNACTGSNEPGQEGSAYPAAPQQEVTQALAKGMERYGDAMNELAKREVKP